MWLFAGAGAIFLCFGMEADRRPVWRCPLCVAGVRKPSPGNMLVTCESREGELVPHTPLPGIIARQQTTGVKLPLQSVTYRQGGSASQTNKGQHRVMVFSSHVAVQQKLVHVSMAVCLHK